MFAILDVLVIVFALKLVEGNGRIEFDGRSSIFVVAAVVAFGGWAASTALALILPVPDPPMSFSRALAWSLGTEAIVTLLTLLLAWATVPGVHIKGAFGLILATILIVGLRYVVAALGSQLLAGI